MGDCLAVTRVRSSHSRVIAKRGNLTIILASAGDIEVSSHGRKPARFVHQDINYRSMDIDMSSGPVPGCQQATILPHIWHELVRDGVFIAGVLVTILQSKSAKTNW